MNTPTEPDRLPVSKEDETDALEASRKELYALLQEGLDDVAAGRTRPIDEVFDEIMKELDMKRATKQ